MLTKAPFFAEANNDRALFDVPAYVEQDAAEGIGTFRQEHVSDLNQLENDAQSHHFIRCYIQAYRLGLEQLQNDLVDQLSYFYIHNLVDPEAITLLGKANLRKSKLYQSLMEKMAHYIRKGFYNKAEVNGSSVSKYLNSSYQEPLKGWSKEDFMILMGIVGACSLRNQATITAAGETKPCQFHIHNKTESCAPLPKPLKKEGTLTSATLNYISVDHVVVSKKRVLAEREKEAPLGNKRPRLPIPDRKKNCMRSRARSPTIEPESPIRSRSSTVQPEPAAPHHEGSEAHENAANNVGGDEIFDDKDSFVLEEEELFLDDFDIKNHVNTLSLGQDLHTVQERPCPAQKAAVAESLVKPLVNSPVRSPVHGKKASTVLNRHNRTSPSYPNPPPNGSHKKPCKQTYVQRTKSSTKTTHTTTPSISSPTPKTELPVAIDSESDTEPAFPKRKFRSLASPPNHRVSLV